MNFWEKVQKDLKILIYPNPTRDSVTIESNQVLGTIEILDLNGRQLISIAGDLQETISLDHLANGVYILRCKGKTERIVKQP